MDRRVQLQTSKQKPELYNEENVASPNLPDPPIHQSSSVTVTNQVATRTQSKVSISSMPVVPDEPLPNCDKLPTKVEEVPRKRIKTLLPVRTNACPSPPAKRRRTIKSMEPEEEQKPTNLPEESILDELINQAVKEGAIINLADTNVPSDHIIEAKVILEPCPVPVSVAIADNQSAPSEPEGTLNVLETPIHPEHQRIQEYLAQRPPLRESVQLKKESILTTEKPYLTHVGESVSQPEIQTNEAQVEVKSIKLLD